MLCFTSILIRQSEQPGATWKTTAMNNNTQKCNYTNAQFTSDRHTWQICIFMSTSRTSQHKYYHSTRLPQSTSPPIQCQCFNYVNDQSVSYCTAQGIQIRQQSLNEHTVYRVDWWIIHHLTPWEYWTRSSNHPLSGKHSTDLWRLWEQIVDI